jgi:pyrroline-5-carboxylate reductase
MKNEMIAFIGAGNMAEALIRGLLAAKIVPAGQLIVTDVRPERLAFFQTTFGVRGLADNAAAMAAADIVVLAVKPQQMTNVLSALGSRRSALVVSIAAGVTTGRIERELGGQPRVVRVMPNTPALVGAGAAGLCRGRFATEEDWVTAEAILGAVGITVRVEESLIDAVTALSGSGPAYVFHVAEAMIQAGVATGLSVDVAKRLTLQTIFGAAKLMVESGEAPEVLRKKVTSPGGTTEAALKVMAERKLVEIFGEAIQAAARRGRELSGS